MGLSKKISPKGQIPLSNFYKIKGGEGVPGPYPDAKFHSCYSWNVGLQPPKSPKLVSLSINLTKRGVPH